MKRCFVISPIGPEGSQVREHADDVFDYIIKPAMEECGIQAVRSDHLQEPGRITEQMFREILTDDLSIAVLTGHNPNVFYELAVAHTVGRPVIVLIEKGESLPFDIRDFRCVSYDLKPRSLFDKVYVNQVVSHIRTLEKAGWKGSSPLGKALGHWGDGDEESPYSFYREANAFGTADTWIQLLRETEKRFEIMGIHLGPWRGGKGFTETLMKKAAEGCEVRILIMHQDNPSLPQMINETIPEVDLAGLYREVDEMVKYFSRIAEKSPNITLRLIKRGTLHCQTTLTDQYGIYLPYMFSRRRRYCPLWHCKTGSSLYDMVVEEFQALWEANKADS